MENIFNKDVLTMIYSYHNPYRVLHNRRQKEVNKEIYFRVHMVNIKYEAIKKDLESDMNIIRLRNNHCGVKQYNNKGYKMLVKRLYRSKKNNRVYTFDDDESVSYDEKWFYIPLSINDIKKRNNAQLNEKYDMFLQAL